MEQVTLYRLYDHEEQLLYVGIAGNPGRRFDQHAKEKAWWSNVGTARMEHYSTRAAAAMAETDAIFKERPRHNSIDNPYRELEQPAAAAPSTGIPQRMAYSPAEAAQLLGVSRSRVYEMMHQGELPSLKIGASRRIRHEDIVQCLTRLASDLAG